jgi:cytosine/adenosine deaminase-related metal-dependent hydrolase
MTIVVEAGHALPVGDGDCVADFAVAIQNSGIVATGSSAALRDQFPTADRIQSPRAVLLPALCDAHDHGRGLGTISLGLPDDALEVWLVGLSAQPVLDPYLLAAYDGLRLLRSGVSTVLHSHNLRNLDTLEDDIAKTLRGYADAGIRVAFDLPIVNQNGFAYDDAAFLASLPADLPPLARQGLDPPRYFQLCDKLAQQYAGNEMVNITMGPSGPQWATDALMVECLEFAQARGLRMHVHCLESWYQREYGFRTWQTSVVRHLEAIGLIGPWLTLAHGVWFEPQDLALLAERGVGVSHNPSSNLRLRSGVAEVPMLLAAGVRLGVGLDGQTLDEDQDMLRELRLAWTLANRPGVSAPAVDAGAIWRMGMEDGALMTLGPELRVGRLEPGYRADLMLVQAGDGLSDWSLGLAGAPDAMSVLPELLLRGASRQHVSDVMVNGTWVVRNWHSCRLDETAIVSALRTDLSERPTRARNARLQAATRAFYASWGSGPPADWSTGELETSM